MAYRFLMFRRSLFLVLGLLAVSPVFAAPVLPTTLIGSWTGTERSGDQRLPVTSTWKVHGAAYVWRERVYSAFTGRLLGTRVITLRFDGSATVKTTRGDRYYGDWSYNHNPRNPRILIGAYDPPHPDIRNDEFVRFSAEIRLSGTRKFSAACAVGTNLDVLISAFGTTETKR